MDVVIALSELYDRIGKGGRILGFQRSGGTAFLYKFCPNKGVSVEAPVSRGVALEAIHSGLMKKLTAQGEGQRAGFLEFGLNDSLFDFWVMTQ